MNFFKLKYITYSVLSLMLINLPGFVYGNNSLSLLHSHTFFPSSTDLKSCQIPIYNHSYDVDSAHFCVIVRYPSHANKLSHFKQQMNRSDLPEEKKQLFTQLYENTILENSANFHLLYTTFKDEFEFNHVYFLPDSSYKTFTSNKKGLFINQFEVNDPSLSCPFDEYYFIINGKDEDQLLFVSKYLSRAPEPLPYKKNIFFPAFKKIFNKPGYLATQVKYFNDKLKNITTQ